MTVAAAIGNPAKAASIAVTHVTRSMRQLRAAQLDEVHAAVSSGATFGRSGYRSPTDWLMAATGESVGQCKLTVHLADRIQRMPSVKAAFAAGDLAEAALRLLADAWHPDIAAVFARDEHLLVRWATTLPHADFKLVIETWRMHADHDREADEADDRFERRALHLSRLMDGVGRLDGILDPEGLKLVREALKTLSAPAGDDTRTPAQRRADALVTMARITLDAIRSGAPDVGDPFGTPDAPDRPGDPDRPARRRRKRWRPKVIATADYFDLCDRSGGGTIDTDSGPIVVTAEALRRLACDAGVHRYLTNAPDHKLHYGRETRTVSDALFDTLTIRDHGCRWPNCPAPPGACDAHHATHWLDLGETEPDNLLLLCWYHHHLLHEQHWRTTPLGAGHFQLTDPHGRVHPLRPPLVGLAPPPSPPTNSPALPGLA